MPRQKVVIRAMLLFALALLAFVRDPSAPAMFPSAIAAALPAATSKLYLPIVRQSPPVPQLLAPANGSNDSFAPVLSWSLPVTGTYQVQMGTDALFATTVLSKTLKHTDLAVTTESIISDNSNLSQQTIFFWRVGVLFNGDFSYSPIWSFTTPKTDTVVLPAKPQIIGSQPLTDTVTLGWNPVPNTLYYRVSIDTDERYGVRSALVVAPKSSEKIEGLSPNKAYTWRVRALSAAGWSKDAQGPSFTTQP